MSTHERAAHKEAVALGSDRSFGLIVGGIVAAIGIWKWLQGAEAFALFLMPGIALVAMGLIAPRLLHPLNVAWMWLGLKLGVIVTPIVMLLVYAVSVVPVGIVMRLVGKDPLGLEKAAPGTSYWIERDPPGPPPESLKDQF